MKERAGELLLIVFCILVGFLLAPILVIPLQNDVELVKIIVAIVGVLATLLVGFAGLRISNSAERRDKHRLKFEVYTTLRTFSEDIRQEWSTCEGLMLKAKRHLGSAKRILYFSGLNTFDTKAQKTVKEISFDNLLKIRDELIFLGDCAHKIHCALLNAERLTVDRDEYNSEHDPAKKSNIDFSKCLLHAYQSYCRVQPFVDQINKSLGGEEKIDLSSCLSYEFWAYFDDSFYNLGASLEEIFPNLYSINTKYSESESTQQPHPNPP